MMFLYEKQRQRHVRFQLPTNCSIERVKSQWTNEKFEDLFNRFKCSVTATYWQSLKRRMEKTNFSDVVSERRRVRVQRGKRPDSFK